MKKILSLLLAAVLMAALSMTAGASAPYVTDTAGILTPQQVRDLDDAARATSESYDFGVYLLIVDDYGDLAGGSVEDVVKTVYRDGGYGAGSSRSGILLLLSMDDRDYALHAYGDMNGAFGGYGHEYLSGEFLDDLGQDQWYEGFLDYIYTCDAMLEAAENGSPVGENLPHARIYGVTVCILLGFLAAFLVTGILKSQLTSVSQKAEAQDFIDPQGLQLSLRTDTYTHTTRTRVYDPPKDNSRSGSSGSSSSTSSGKF